MTGPLTGKRILLAATDLIDAERGGDPGGAFFFPVAGRRKVPCMFLTGHDEWALPLSCRMVGDVAEPIPIASVPDVLPMLVEGATWSR